MNDPGPGAGITDAQIQKARTWARGLADVAAMTVRRP